MVLRGGAGGHGVVSPSRQQNKARQSRAERAARVRAGNLQFLLLVISFLSCTGSQLAARRNVGRTS